MNTAQIEYARSFDGAADEHYFARLRELGEEPPMPDEEAASPGPSTIPSESTATVQPPSLAHERDILERASAKQRPDSAPDHALRDVRQLFTTYIEFVRPEQVDALTLWTAYTHWFGRGQAFSFVPYMLVTSAERQSGKSTVLELAAMLVHEPLDGQDMSAALVGRRCGGRTLLLDEIDGVYSSRDSGDDSGSTDLRTVLNAGFKYDGKYLRLDRKSMEPQEWSVYGPKMLVGIGRNVPDTVADRSIAIRMVRKAHAARLPKLRSRLVRPVADALRERLAKLAETVELAFVDDFPEVLDGRRQDIWEPLYALARAAGGEWLDRAISASVELTKAEPSVSLGVQLLSDIRELFEQRGDPEMIATAELIGRPEDRRDGTQATGLCAIEESPWATFTRGRAVTPHKVSVLLSEFDIRPERAPAGGHTYGPKGYWRVRFAKAWDRYLVTSATSDTFTPITKRPSETPTSERKGSDSPLSEHETDVSDVSATLEWDAEHANDDTPEPAS